MRICFGASFSRILNDLSTIVIMRINIAQRSIEDEWKGERNSSIGFVLIWVDGLAAVCYVDAHTTHRVLRN